MTVKTIYRDGVTIMGCRVRSRFPGAGVLPIMAYREAPPERGTFFRLQVYKRVGISQDEVYKRVGKSVVSQRELNE